MGVEPGAPVEGLEDLWVRSVARFVDHASPAERRRLFESNALTSTSILVGRAGTLMELAARTLPEVLEALEPLDDALDRTEESLLCDAVYEDMPENDLAAARARSGAGGAGPARRRLAGARARGRARALLAS